MNRITCCHGDCNQGRACPHRAAVPPTRREWLFAIGSLVLVIGLSMLSGCDASASSQASSDQNGGHVFFVYTDPLTQCQYLKPVASSGITPRIAADGKTHMGCKGAMP